MPAQIIAKLSSMLLSNYHRLTIKGHIIKGGLFLRRTYKLRRWFFPCFIR